VLLLLVLPRFPVTAVSGQAPATHALPCCCRRLLRLPRLLLLAWLRQCLARVGVRVALPEAAGRGQHTRGIPRCVLLLLL
jgi:hypothetical protein